VIKVTAWKEDPVSGEWRQEVNYVRDPAEVKKHKAHEEHLKRKNRQAISAAEEG